MQEFQVDTEEVCNHHHSKMKKSKKNKKHKKKSKSPVSNYVLSSTLIFISLKVMWILSFIYLLGVPL